jgi:hypothetical protein
MWLAPAFHHGPRPLLADFHARFSSSPLACSLWLRVAGRFHCRHRRQRSLRRIHPSKSCSAPFTPLSRKYDVQPRSTGLSSLIVATRQSPHAAGSNGAKAQLSYADDYLRTAGIPEAGDEATHTRRGLCSCVAQTGRARRIRCAPLEMQLQVRGGRVRPDARIAGDHLLERHEVRRVLPRQARRVTRRFHCGDIEHKRFRHIAVCGYRVIWTPDVDLAI